MTKKLRTLLFLCFFFISPLFLSAQSETKIDPLCGPNSLLIVCKKLEVDTNLDELKRLSGYSEINGTNMAGLYKAAIAKGLNAVGMKISLDELANLDIPIIAYLWKNHYVVIDKFAGDNLRVIDSSKESYWKSREDFANDYSGFALLIAKDKSSFPEIETTVPDIRFEGYVYDLGEVEKDKTTELFYIFKFKNAGDEDLIISRVRACCGAKAMLLSEKTVPPGGEGKVKATVDIAGREGAQDYYVYVYSNDPITPVVKLYVKGIIKEGLRVIPENIFLGHVKKSALKVRKLCIIEPEGEEFKILKIETLSKHLSTRASRSTVKNRKGWEVEVALKPDIPIGELNEKITIYTTSKKHPKIEIPVTGNIKGDIEYYPNMFFLGSVKRGETSMSKLTLSTAGKEHLKVERIENPLSHVSIAINPKIEGRKYELIASLKDNAPKGSIKGNIIVHTNNPDQPQIQIPVYALIRE